MWLFLGVGEKEKKKRKNDDGRLDNCCVCLVIYFGPIFGCVFWYVYSPSGVGWCVHS